MYRPSSSGRTSTPIRDGEAVTSIGTIIDISHPDFSCPVRLARRRAGEGSLGQSRQSFPRAHPFDVVGDDDADVTYH